MYPVISLKGKKCVSLRLSEFIVKMIFIRSIKKSERHEKGRCLSVAVAKTIALDVSHNAINAINNVTVAQNRH
jgi:hypothetical protein